MDNLDVKSEYDYILPSQRTLGRRRKVVVVMYLSYLIATVGLWLLGTVAGIHSQDSVGQWIYLLSILGVSGLISIGCGSWLYASIRNVAKAGDRELDERQRMVRDRAYRYAYITVTAVFLLFMVSRMETAITTGMLQNLALFWGILQLFWTLPTAIIAWTEREV